VQQLDPDERVRLLEVADSVTKALGIELRYALSDSHPEVRQAAYRLIERLNDKQVARVLVDYAKHGNPSVAVEAIACLGKLKPAGLTAVLSWLLRTSKEPERQTACCQVIGRLGDAAAVAALTDVVAPKGFFRSRKRYHPDVRAAAAYALSRIGGPLVTRLLATLVNDQDPRVREIARVASKHQA
jgi:HEAT repeat protein